MMERHWRSSPPREIPIPGTPTAFHRSAQGCRSREAAKATLGLRSKIIMNPNGFHPFGRRRIWDAGFNPVGVVSICWPVPRVARARVKGPYSPHAAHARKRALQPSRGARAFPRLACQQAFGPRYIGVSTVFRLSAGFLTRRVNGHVPVARATGYAERSNAPRRVRWK